METPEGHEPSSQTHHSDHAYSIGRSPASTGKGSGRSSTALRSISRPKEFSKGAGKVVDHMIELAVAEVTDVLLRHRQP